MKLDNRNEYSIHESTFESISPAYPSQERRGQNNEANEPGSSLPMCLPTRDISDKERIRKMKKIVRHNQVFLNKRRELTSQKANYQDILINNKIYHTIAQKTQQLKGAASWSAQNLNKTSETGNTTFDPN